MTHKDVQLELHDDIAIVRLCRPAKRNALSDGLILAVREIFETMTTRRDFTLQSLALAAAGLPFAAQAQSLQLARIICGFPAGGTSDAMSRRIADKLRGGYAKTVLVDNKVGAGGRLAVEELTRSTPDGGTLLLTPAAM